MFGSCRCVNCVVFPHTANLCSGLVGVSIVLCINVLRSGDLYPGVVDVSIVLCTGDLYQGIVGVLCIQALATCI